MSLQHQLDALKVHMKTVIPEHVWVEMERQIEDLRQSGLLARVPKVGDRAPTFTLPSSTGESVTFADLLATGPVVLSFYRGRW